jgi:hypothetical protein
VQVPRRVLFEAAHLHLGPALTLRRTIRDLAGKNRCYENSVNKRQLVCI